MNSRGILDFRLVADIANSVDIEKTLYSILDTLECMQINGTAICYADAIYDQIIFMKAFSDWIYDLNADPELSSFKKELSKRINKSACIDAEEYNALMSNVEETSCTNEELIMSVHCETSNILYVASSGRYWSAKQWYLATYVKRHDFFSNMTECFPNLFFHEHVASSINTLNADFSVERPFIVRHLQALNDFMPDFSSFSAEGMDYRRICEKFQEYSHIECSPQSDRKAAQKLNYKFTNTCTGQEIVVCCELHTKLKWDGMDRANQDRIYFHPGKPEIANGKVLIVHIGTHQ